MKILIGITTYPTDPRIYARTQNSLDELDYGNHQVMVEYVGDDDPALEAMDNLTVKHNYLRQMVLEHGHDALLTIEADMIVPADALAMLAAVDADVAYAAYASRAHPMVITFPTIDGYKGRSISADMMDYKSKFGSVIACEGVGFGCTLIRRNVLEAIEFRRDKSTVMRRKFADDWTFALDVKAGGFKSAAHLGVLCGHIQRDGRVRWVDADAPQFVRIEGEASGPGALPALPAQARYHVLKWLSSPTAEYAPGTDIELSADAAAILLTLGKIKII